MAPRSAGWDRRRWTLVAFLAGALVAGSVGALIPRRTLPTSLGVFRASLFTPDVQFNVTRTHALAISPDGRRVVIAADGRLLLRELDAMEALPIRGTESAGRFAFTSEPVFSPDGAWILFTDDGRELKKVPVHGGIPTTLCATGVLYGASWPVDAFILFASEQGVFRLPANGGVPEVVVEVDSEKGEIAQGPRLLPDGDTLLFALGNAGNWDEASIVAHSLTTDERQVLIRGGADAVYASTGHLLYANGNTLYAAPFDPRQLELKGGPVPVVEGISRSDGNGTAQYSVSSTGSIVYIKDLGQETTLAWTDRGGGSPELIGAPRRSYRTPRLSPDGKRLLVLLEGDLWLYDLLRSSWTRLTFIGSADYPVWTPDGTRVVFSSTEKGSANLYWVPADGSGEAEAMLEPGLERHADSISRDGRWLTFHEHNPTTGTDLWRIRLGGELEAQPYLATPFNERIGVLSPDGQWLAYVSDETGRNEIYVRSFPEPASKYSISSDGGGAPTWSHAGRELFFVRRDRNLMVVEVTTVPEFRASPPKPLFGEAAAGVDLSTGGNYLPNYDVTSGADRFLTLQTQGDAVPQVHLVVNWFEELQQRVPTDK